MTCVFLRVDTVGGERLNLVRSEVLTSCNTHGPCSPEHLLGSFEG